MQNEEVRPPASGIRSPFPPLAPVQKPRKVLVPLSVGLTWAADPEYIYQEKMDGRFETHKVRAGKSPAERLPCNGLGETILAGEYVRGEFYAFDLLQLHGEDCRHWPLCDRLAWLDQVFHSDPVDCTGGAIRRVTSANDGGELLARVLAAGGEGVVRKRLDSPWGTPMEACKRLETFYCVVTGFNAWQSVAISRIIGAMDTWINECRNPSTNPLIHPSMAAIPCGSVPLRGGKCDQVRIGSIVKIEGFGLTKAGQIREPRPCKDTPTSWLVKY